MQFILGFLCWVGVLVYSGWALTLLWSWFITPFGVASITVPWGIGLMCVGTLFKGVRLQDEDDSPWKDILLGAAWVTITLIIGFVASLFL